MSIQKNILKKIQPDITELDRKIKEMEEVLGKQYSVSPFTELYARYDVTNEPDPV